jgi:hypothetical protein
MNKNDKLIAVIGVVILVIASIGIYTWKPGETMQHLSSIDDFFVVSSSLSNVPDAVAVSDANPFYALIATPLAVHYNTEGKQEIIPMYVQNYSDPSRAISRAEEQIDIAANEFIDDSRSVKEWSIELAKKYWNSSEAALIIENNESGYNLGVMATPLASYLSIPIIVTDELDHQIREVFNELGVKRTLICGDNIEGYGDVLRFNTVEEIVDNTTKLLIEKFGDIDYITITNPIDAWPPEVLDSEEWIFEDTFGTMATTELLQSVTAGSNKLGTFTIPSDYKYALVKFKGINLHSENVNELGDNVMFMCGVTDEDEYEGLQRFEVFVGGTGGGGVPVRDANGKIIEDITYNEAVLYDRGGMEYQITVSPTWLASNEGKIRAEITVEKLSDPIYPMMKRLSSVAPYLTAYHKGLIFGKPEFAFAADDEVLYVGEPSPGFYMPRRNPRLIEASNDHIFSIHEEINDILEKLAGISTEREYDLKYLREHYKNNPIYIALVGGATVLPQYIYDTPSMPATPFEDVSYYVGAGIPSDFIYANIDPSPGDWSSQAPDLYSEYPFQENIIGRITGWDVQDASALITRTIFYDEIIDDMDEWKDNAAVQLGGGNDFQKPFVRYKIFGELLGMTHRGEPMKMQTGASYLNGLALQKNVEKLGFATEYIRENAATYQGFSNDAIDMIKKANVLNKLLLSKQQLKKNVGIDIAVGGQLQENSNFILANAHGNQHMFGMGDVGIYKLGIGLPNGILERVLEKVATLMGFGPGLSLSDYGYYNTRNVENMDLGPSFLWIESCICGKIDGVYPKQGISQAYLHSGCNAVIAATTSSNVPGGYLEGKNTKYDFPGQTALRYIQANGNAKNDIYPEMHFGFKIYSDLCEELKTEDTSIGLAYREARNRYLPEDADWPVWWAPPLVFTGLRDIDAKILELSSSGSQSDLEPRLDNKFMSFYEYALYADPAFVPYVPFNS